MKGSITEFNQKISNLISYIEAIEIEKDFISQSRRIIEECSRETACGCNTLFEKISISCKKIIDYHAVIISLYGAFESFVESICTSYLKRLNEIIPTYESFPDKIKENHIIFSSELILELHKSKYSSLDQLNIIKNMYDCVNSQSPFRINCEAFIMHNTNLRPAVLNEIFTRIGINGICNQIKNTDLFRDYYAKKNDINSEQTASVISKLDLDELFIKINDLIEKRNLVAHSWIDETVDLNIIKEDYVAFFEVFCNALYHLLEESISGFEVLFKGKKITIVRIFNKCILCFNNDNAAIRIGGKILIKKTDSSYTYGFIESIEHNHQRIENVRDTENIDIGVKISSKAKDSYEYFLLLD